MKATRGLSETLTVIVAKVELKAAGLREEYAYFYLREAFPDRAEGFYKVNATWVLRFTGE